MKWTFLAALLSLGFSSVVGQPDPSMMCFTSIINNEYTAVVSVTNMDNPPSNSFAPCNINHDPGFNSSDVVTIQIVGSSRNIPTAVCQMFSNARRLTSTNILLDKVQFLYDCHNLAHVDLSLNNIAEINSNAFTNNHLRHLDLSRNQIRYTHEDSLINLWDLEVLNFSFNEDIPLNPGFFQHSIHLKELNVSNSKLTLLQSRWFYNLTELTTLDISQNVLTEIPKNAFSPLASLKTLEMHSCNFTSLAADTFHHNTELEYLDMSSNSLVTIDGALLRSQTSLITLKLSNNAFEPLPDEVFQSLQSLQILEMNNCNIQSLKVSWFASMSELRVLSMWKNLIREIPYKTFGVENNLEELYLQNNELEVLDATSFALLRNLKELRVDNNKIYAVDSHFIQQPAFLNMAWFLNNECVDVNIDDFHVDRAENLELFRQCFHNFDQLPVNMDTSPDETYRWYSMRWEALVFHVRAAENVSIIFSDIQSEEHGETLKIQIGMDRNFYTFIYENGTRVWEQSTEGILDELDWRSFVISWRSNVLQFYEKDWQLPLATHTILRPFEINFFGVRSDSAASFHILRVEKNFKHEDFPEVV